MAAKDLITLARAKQDIQAITDASQEALIAVLITAVSDAIAKDLRAKSNKNQGIRNPEGEGMANPRLYPMSGIHVMRSRWRDILNRLEVF